MNKSFVTAILIIITVMLPLPAGAGQALQSSLLPPSIEVPLISLLSVLSTTFMPLSKYRRIGCDS